VAPGKRKAWAQKLLKRFGMEEHGEKFPDNLSGGQAQRVSVARSMVNNPDILLADEPTGNLDSISTKQVMSALEEINSVDKKTVIIITHNAAQLSYAHRVFYMKDGRLERVVPNPEKKQIAKIDKQKILVTEMDKLSKIFPYKTPVELKVKSLVNYLTQDLDFDQLERLEESIKLVVERKVKTEEFKKMVKRRFSEGGVGLSESVANTMGDKIAKILNQSEDVRRYRRRFLANNFYGRESVLVNNLTDYIVDEYNGNLTSLQRKRLKELVHKRVAGLLNKNEFKQGLRAGLDEGGVGLSQVSARKLTLYFEKIIIQGLETKGHGH
jgi:ABC-type glutathione transport system ATPase component